MIPHFEALKKFFNNERHTFSIAPPMANDLRSQRNVVSGFLFYDIPAPVNISRRRHRPLPGIV